MIAFEQDMREAVVRVRRLAVGETADKAVCVTPDWPDFVAREAGRELHSDADRGSAEVRDQRSEPLSNSPAPAVKS